MPSSRKVAYLVNRYPAPTHSFIRREIRALEELGLEVVRFSVRAPQPELPDPRDRDEAEQTVALLSKGGAALAAAAVQVALGSPRRFLRALGCALRLGWRSYSGLPRHLAYLVEACALLQELRRTQAAHLHAHFGTNSAAVALLACELGGPPFSFTVHGPDEFDHPQLLHLREKVAACRFVVAISEFTRSQLWRWIAVEHWPRVRCVRCGLGAEHLEAPPTPVPDTARLVCVGRLSATKGQRVLLQAVARLAGEGVPVELDLIGDGEQRASLEAEARRLGLAERVRFRGWQGQPAIQEAIRASRGLVLSSFAEGLPVVLMEAFALGRPVVASRIAGIPELVIPGENGWLVTPGDVRSLAQALRELLGASVERLSAMGQAGWQSVQQRHDVRQSARELLACFEDPPADGDSIPSRS